MTFQATVKEIDNGFLVSCNPKVLEYEEVYALTFGAPSRICSKDIDIRKSRGANGHYRVPSAQLGGSVNLGEVL